MQGAAGVGQGVVKDAAGEAEVVGQRAEKVTEGDRWTMAVGVWIFLRIHRRVYALSHGEWHSMKFDG